MRHLLNSCTVGCVLAVFAGLALAGPPTDEQVREAVEAFKERREAAFQGGAASRQVVRELFSDPLGDLQLSEMTPRQIAMITREGMLQGIPGEAQNPLRDEAVQRLEKFRDQDDVEGAIASILLLEMQGAIWQQPRPTEETQRQLLQRALHHPKRDEAVRQHDLRIIPAVNAAAGPNLQREFREELLGLRRLFDGEPSPPLAIDGGDYLELVSSILDAADPRQAAQREEIRAKVAEYARRTIDATGEAATEAERRFMETTLARIEGAAARGQLIGHPAPQLDFLWSSHEGLKSLDDLKGNVVVLDFWATWCGPCIASFPQVRELQERYEGYPVKIVGVTSVQGSHIPREGTPISTKGDPEKEFELMRGYMNDQEINWIIAFSKQEVFNPDYGIRGIPHVVILDAEGKVRHAGLHPGGPIGPKAQKIDALLKEAGLATPPPVEQPED